MHRPLTFDEMRGFHRQAHHDLYTYAGRWLGMGFGFNAADAANVAQRAGAPVAYARPVGEAKPTNNITNEAR